MNMKKTLEDRVAEYVEGVKSLNPEVTWDLLHTAVIFGYHMGVEDEMNKPCKSVN